MASSTFIIKNTAGTAVAAIQPNTLDGPDGVQQNSDLRMYGLGFPNWGEGVNENDYRLVENFACPSVAAFPASARYTLLGPIVAAVTPAGEASDELGTGNGINKPIVGQLWFNTTDLSLFINKGTLAVPAFTPTASNAVTSGATPPLSPYQGELWYDTTVPQLKVWSGLTWNSVANLYLPLTGGTLSGVLNMSVHKIINLATPTASSDAATKGYVDAATGAISGFLPISGGTLTGALTISGGGLTVQSGLPVNLQGTASLTLTNGSITVVSPTSGIALSAGGGRVANLGAPVGSTDAATKNYVDTNPLFLLKSGGTMSGFLTLNANPTVPLHAATKAYVDAAVGPGFTQSIAANGWVKLPNGLMIQWGSFSGPGSAITTVFFPTAFPTACFSVTANQQPSTSYGYTSTVQSVNTVSFSYHGAGSSGLPVYWQAIGH